MVKDYKITICNTIAKDFRTAPLFLGYQIDLLTDGNKSIEAVCKEKNIDLLNLMSELNDIALTKRISSSDYSSWPLGLLMDMMTIRHRFIRENMPVIQQFLDRLSEVHERQDTLMIDLCISFNICAERLIFSLQKLVPVLISYSKQIVDREEDKEFFATSTFETVSSSIREMINELSLHKSDFLSVVERIIKYKPSLKDFNCYKITLDLLAEFQCDLFKIIGLQNIFFNHLVVLRKDYGCFLQTC